MPEIETLNFKQEHSLLHLCLNVQKSLARW